ncbi:MAG: hypothetical protein V1822_03300 [Candidatus Micrarchaeota archaeon]
MKCTRGNSEVAPFEARRLKYILSIYGIDVMYMVMAQIEIDEYSNRVLNVIKAKFNLHDKAQALSKFIHMHGEEYVEKEPKEEYVKKILEICDEHMKKYPKRRMSQKEFDELFEG